MDEILFSKDLGFGTRVTLMSYNRDNSDDNGKGDEGAKR